MANFSMPINPFPVPTGVTLQLPTGKKQDGVQPLPTLMLSQLSEETLAELCEDFTKAVFAAAGKEL
jgi:hypothetical protein